MSEKVGSVDNVKVLLESGICTLQEAISDRKQTLRCLKDMLRGMASRCVGTSPSAIADDKSPSPTPRMIMDRKEVVWMAPRTILYRDPVPPVLKVPSDIGMRRVSWRLVVGPLFAGACFRFYESLS